MKLFRRVEERFEIASRIFALFLFIFFLSYHSVGETPVINASPIKFIVNTDYLAIPEGETREFYISLSAEPPGDVLAWIHRSSGDPDISVPAGVNPVSIPQSQWNTPVAVPLQAAEDADSIDGTTVYQVWESTSWGVKMAQLIARELDNDNVMDVGGTLTENTVWDASHNYRLTSTLTIPEGISLTIQPGCSLVQSGVFRAFEVSGSLSAEDNFFLLNTHTDWNTGDRPDERKNSFNFYGSSQGIFKRCVFQCVENSSHSLDYYDDWSAAVWITDTADVSIRGAKFYSLNSLNGWRTAYGVKIDPEADAQIIDDSETGAAIRSTFAGFRSGVGWTFGTGQHEVALCSFSDCGENVRLWGNVENNTVLNNANQLMGGGIYVKESATLTFSPGSEIHSSGAWLDFHVYGKLAATQADLNLDTWTDVNTGDRPDERHNAIYFFDGAEGDFSRCRFFSDERRNHSIDYYDDWSAIIYCQGSVQLTVKGCSFESLNRVNPDWRTTFGIYLSPETQALIGDFTQGAQTDNASFKGFVTGIYMPFGSGSAQIANCQYVDIFSNIRIAGDVTHNINLPVDSMHSLGNITVKSGAALNFPPGSQFFSLPLSRVLTVEAGATMNVVESVFTMGHPMKISGTLDCDFTTMTLDTWTDVNVGDRPDERFNGIDILDGGSAAFNKCVFKSIEKRSHSIDYYDDWSAIINTEGSSTLVVKGCSFESLNTQNPNWWTTFGIRLTGGVNATIQDYDAEPPVVRNSFKSFRTGIQLNLGVASPQIGVCDYENCLTPIRTGGDVFGNVILPPNVALHLGYNISVKSGGSLKFSDYSVAHLLDRVIRVESGGALECENAQLWVETRRNRSNWNERNALYFDDGSSGAFNNSSVYFYETSTSTHENCVLFATGDVDLFIQGTLFTPHPDCAAGPYPYHVIWSETTGNLDIQNSAFLNTGATGLLIQNNFPATHVALDNHFQGNSMAINNKLTTTFMARNNWWGAASGPTHNANPGGTGDPVSNFVDYGNYLLDSPHPAVLLLDPLTGQEADNFGVNPSQQNVELLGFQVVPTSSDITQIVFRFFDRIGIVAADVSNLRIMLDDNGNGNIDPGENLVIADQPAVSIHGADIVAVFSGFTSSSNPNHNYILVGDFSSLSEGDRLRVEIEAGLFQAAFGMIPDSRVSSAFHIVGSQLVLADPVTGQEPDNLDSSASQSNVELLGFRFIGFAREVVSISFDLSDITDVKDANIVSARLVRDVNNNGVADSWESAVGGAGQVSISGSTGIILFNASFSSNGSFILVADFAGLVSGAALEVNLSTANISVSGEESVYGYASPASHQVDSAFILAESHYWMKPASFGATPTQISYPLLGFILFPGGRDVASLKIGISGMAGIQPADVSNAKLWWDFNGDGAIDANDVLLDTGVVNVVNGEGFIEFDAGFVTRGDLIVTADFVDLAEYDEFTAYITPQEIEIPGGGLVLGSGPRVRHAVDGGIENSRGENQNWTLVYRSPGGQSVNGRFNHAGDLLILGYDTGSAWIYDAESNTPLLTLKEHYDKVMYAGFNSDDTAAVTVTRDGAVFIWDLATGAKRSEMFSDLLVTSAIPSPDFSKLMVITEGKGLLLDIDLQKRLWEFVPGDATVNAIAYSPDGVYIAIGSSDKRAYILDAETGVEADRFLVHAQAVTAVGFTGDGKYLMTSSTDATAQVIDLESRIVVNSISLQGQSSQTATVSSDGTRVAMITGTGNSALLRMFDENGLELFAVNIATLSGSRWGGTVVSLCFDDAGERVLVTSGGAWAPVACFRADNGAFIRHWGPSGNFEDNLDKRARVSEDGSKIFYMSSWGLDLLPTSVGKPILTHPSIGSRGFDISSDGTKLVWFQSSRLYMDQVTDFGFQSLQNHLVGINYNALTVSRSGSMVIAGDRLFSALTGLVMANYAVPDAEYRGAFSPDQRLWGFAIPADKSLITMRANDPKALLYNMMDTAPYTPYKMFYHPDGKRIACVNNTHAQNPGVQFFDMDTYLPVGLYRFEQNKDACLSQDGTMLLIGGANNVRLFDVHTGRVIRYFFPQHSGLLNVNVRSVQFAKDDTMIMIAWSPNYVELYERSKATRIKLSPASRTLAPEESQAFTVEVEYDDGTKG